MPSISARAVELCLVLLILHCFLENLERFLQIFELPLVKLSESSRIPDESFKNLEKTPRTSLSLLKLELLAVGLLFYIRPHGGRQMFLPVD